MLANIDMTVASTILLGVAIMAAVAVWVIKDEADKSKFRDDYDWDI